MNNMVKMQVSQKLKFPEDEGSYIYVNHDVYQRSSCCSQEAVMLQLSLAVQMKEGDVRLLKM